LVTLQRLLLPRAKPLEVESADAIGLAKIVFLNRWQDRVLPNLAHLSFVECLVDEEAVADREVCICQLAVGAVYDIGHPFEGGPIGAQPPT
jgi:hypothetical protein